MGKSRGGSNAEALGYGRLAGSFLISVTLKKHTGETQRASIHDGTHAAAMRFGPT